MSQQIVQDIKDKLWQLSRDELHEVNELLVHISKSKRKSEIAEKKKQFTVGDLVRFHSRKKNMTMNCKLMELRRTKASVKDVETGEWWTVPISLLSPREPIFNTETGEFY